MSGSGSGSGSKHLVTRAELERESWATCGPGSLAALLGRPVAAVRPGFPRLDRQRWTNIAQMREALTRLNIPHRPDIDPLGEVDGIPAYAYRIPRCGLALVQFRGSWDTMPPNHPAQLHRTHWIAAAPVGHPIGDLWLAKPGVFDVNSIDDERGDDGWMSRETWDADAADFAVWLYGKKATGQWWVRSALEVDCR